MQIWMVCLKLRIFIPNGKLTVRSFTRSGDRYLGTTKSQTSPSEGILIKLERVGNYFTSTAQNIIKDKLEDLIKLETSNE